MEQEISPFPDTLEPFMAEWLSYAVILHMAHNPNGDISEHEKAVMNARKRSLNRLSLLVSLTDVLYKDLKDYLIISIGGGGDAGDGYLQPWLPRFAGSTGARVLNFDIQPMNSLDIDLHLYEHIGENDGDVLQLLAIDNEKLHQYVTLQDKLLIIETSFLMGVGYNVSPTLVSRFGGMQEPLTSLRNSLLEFASYYLVEGGILAIDNCYWKIINSSLTAINADGTLRNYQCFPGEIEEYIQDK